MLSMGGRFRPAAGEPGIRFQRSISGWPLQWHRSLPLLRGDHVGCVERRATIRLGGRDHPTHGACEFDGRLASVLVRGTLYLFARANLRSEGGARHVQVSSLATSSARFGRREWSPFRLLRFDNYSISRENNIYFFLAQRYKRGLLGVFPAVIDGVGGIYMAVSTDAVSWSRPTRIMRSHSVGGRTGDHPVHLRLERDFRGELKGPSDRRVWLHVEHRLSTVAVPPVTGNKSKPPYHCLYELDASILTRHMAKELRHLNVQ